MSALPGGPAPDRAHGALLAHLRHELRTPVNAILGYTEMLLEDEAPGQASPDLRKIQSAGRTVLQLINEILDPARLAAGGDLDAAGARIRHDLRTPVNAILGYSEMLIEDAGEGGNGFDVDDLKRIHGAGQKLLAVIDDIVRLSTGGAATALTRANDDRVSHMIEQAVSSMRALREPDRAGSGGGRILVVDDNEINRDMLSRRLGREGYIPVSARDGREALERLHAEPFDLVLLDILMPEMNGYEVLERMKADVLLRHIPVIMVSALDQIDSVVRCIEIGAEDYLSKPFDPVLLQARIGASLEKKRLRDREVLHLRQIEAEKKRADELLHVILPPDIVQELKASGKVAPRRHEDVAVLFCDIVGFTPYSARRQPEEIVAALQLLFEAFEDLAAAHDMYKIKTIGDSFMSTAGLITPAANPVLSAVRCGLEMVRAAKSLPAGWDVRVGIHAGPVVAGVVGRKQYLYDLWGDTVNTAARVESHGSNAAVNLSASAWARVEGHCRGRSLGLIPVKGKGEMEIFRVEGLR
ncbi:MAG TPA: adenylate/guanylate cyclase domain-containing protein [Vicinamibacteria bacterium]|nr:adenylate/guanylate cyclase domain-containing protein [Vicinamibacteria bacterium]